MSSRVQIRQGSNSRKYEQIYQQSSQYHHLHPRDVAKQTCKALGQQIVVGRRYHSPPDSQPTGSANSALRPFGVLECTPHISCRLFAGPEDADSHPGRQKTPYDGPEDEGVQHRKIVHAVNGIKVLARALVIDAGDHSSGIAPVGLLIGGVSMVLDVGSTDVSDHGEMEVAKRNAKGNEEMHGREIQKRQ